jgi:hypothetical protein
MKIKEVLRRFLNVCSLLAYGFIVVFLAAAVISNYSYHKQTQQENQNLERVLALPQNKSWIEDARSKKVAEFRIRFELEEATKLDLPYNLKYNEPVKVFEWWYLLAFIGALAGVEIIRAIIVYIFDIRGVISFALMLYAALFIDKV